MGLLDKAKAIKESLDGKIVKNNERKYRRELDQILLEQNNYSEVKALYANNVISFAHKWADGNFINHICINETQGQVELYREHTASNFPITITHVPAIMILSCEIIDDKSTITKGGVGRAMIGAALAGGAGAIVGSTSRSSSNVCEYLAVQIITNNPDHRLITVPFIQTQIERDQFIYRTSFNQAMQLKACIISLMQQNNSATAQCGQKHQTQLAGISSRLKELQSLNNSGLITDEEYQAKKQKIIDEL